MNDALGPSDEREALPRTYRPPQKLLVPCPDCGVTVLRGLMINGRVKKQSPPLTPIYGKTHVCKTREQSSTHHAIPLETRKGVP
jgi:hypothetical protein